MWLSWNANFNEPVHAAVADWKQPIINRNVSIDRKAPKSAVRIEGAISIFC